MIYTACQILCGGSNEGGWDGQGMWHMWGEKRNACRILVGKLERH
jgi:hypothetical protein